MNEYYRDMTKRKTIHIVATGLLILLLSSCKKYGYDFANGYPTYTADSSTITVDTSMSVPDYSMYAQASIFPGVVGDDAPRLTSYPVTLNLDFIKNPSQLRMAVLPQAQLSTGLYAPTGEPITVDVPANVYGLTAQIGCWTDNLTAKDAANPDAIKREPIVYTVKQLFPGRNYIRSPFGGPIYVNSPFATGQSVTLKFSGACKMTDFILGQTDENAWQDSIKNSKVPWFELRAPHIIFTVETEKAQRIGITKLQLLMQTWEDIFNKDYSQWEGLSDNPTDPIDQAAGLPWRVVADIDPVVGYGHNGYPVVIQDDDHWFKNLTNVDVILASGDWGVLHEVGHNNQQSNWSFSNMGETTNNLFSFKTGNRLGYRPHQDYSNALAFAAKIDASKNFLTDPSLSNDPIGKCAFYLQIFDKFGFDFMTMLYTRTRHAIHTSNNDQDRIDFVYDAMCDFTHLNMLPFFNAWGLRVSQQQQDIETAKGYPYLHKKIWLYDPQTRTGGDDPIPVIYDDYARTDWQAIDINNDYDIPTGRSPQNLLDGNPATVWHMSKTHGYPHTATIDMQEVHMIDGLSYVQREASDAVKNVEILVSNDNVNWTSLGNFVFSDALGTQRVDFANRQNCRYFRIICNSDYAGNNFTALAELGAYSEQ
ncbi:M60 family metallopeptidase [Arachidicoccus sp.]|uniref:M60 family metallopeptidase n=1 Tax=Arachidicoccus sp. TaxID=1872624 RepID=UPI003D2092E9